MSFGFSVEIVPSFFFSLLPVITNTLEAKKFVEGIGMKTRMRTKTRTRTRTRDVSITSLSSLGLEIK